MKKILKHTWSLLIKKEKKHFIVLLFFDTIISILDILFLAMLLWIIQFYIQPSQKNLSFLPDWLLDKNSVALIAAFLILFAIKNIAGFFTAAAHYRFNGNVALRITKKNLYNYQHGGFDEFISTDSSVHIRGINLQPFEFCQHILSGIQQISTQFFLILLAVIAIILFDARLFFLLLIILLPPVVVIFYLAKGKINKAKKHIRSSNERSYQHLMDILKGYVESNIYNSHDFFSNRYISKRKEFSKSLFETISIQNMPPRIIEIFAVLGLFILIAIAKWTGYADSSYLVMIGAFMAAAYKIIPGVVKIINLSGQVRTYEFIVNDLEKDNRNNVEKNNKSALNKPDAIQLRNIHFSYGNKQILNNFSLVINTGDLITISGPSGIGKTTILSLLLGFLSPAKGEIIINNIPVDAKTIKNYWPFISYVRQQSFLIHDTLLRNITFLQEGYDQQKLQCALNISGLNDLIQQSPEGLNKMIMENGKNISGGQQQRIALARALYKNADLILLDEPFNELDEISTFSILAHLKELAAKGKMIVLISHDKKTLSYANKIISLDA